MPEGTGFSNEQQFYDEQPVAPGHLLKLQYDLEEADVKVLEALALGSFPHSGLVPQPDNATLVMPVTAGVGIALDAAGRGRIVELVAGDTVNFTPHLPSTNPRWVLVALQFTRIQSVPPTTPKDGDGNTVQYIQNCSAELVLVAGAENASPVKPPIGVDMVPICDVKLTVGKTSIDDKDIDRSRARPAWARFTGSGSVPDALADLAALTLDNCRVYPSEPGSMTVRVRAGAVNFGAERFLVAAGMVGPLAAASAGNSYIALVYIDTNGAIQSVSGDESGGTPTPPSHLGVMPLAHVRVYDNTVTDYVRAQDIIDVRPFLRSASDALRRYENQPGAGAGVDVTLPFTYVPGNNSLLVFVKPNGESNYKLVDPDDYVETDSSTVTIDTVANNGDWYLFLAGVPAMAMPPDFTAAAGLVLPGFEAYSTGDTAITIKPFTLVIQGQMMTQATDVALAAELAGLNASAWYYCYAFLDNAGAIDVEVSLTGPDAQRRMKSGDSTRTYLFPIRTTTASKVRAFHRVNRRHRWIFIHNSGTAGDPTYPICGATTVGAAQNVSLVNGIPPHVRFVELMVKVEQSVAGGSTGGSVAGNGAQSSAWGTNYMGFTRYEMAGVHSTDNSNQVFVTAQANIDLTMIVTQFDE